jgi:hypothetical protein
MRIKQAEGRSSACLSFRLKAEATGESFTDSRG